MGMRVISDMVFNHVSSSHQWFQDARLSEDNPKRDWFVWSKDASQYKDVRVIFNDIEPSNWTWDGTAGAYYWHRFFSHQPDLNYDNPKVRDEMMNVVRYWLKLGIDGFRCDAVTYLCPALRTGLE